MSTVSDAVMEEAAIRSQAYGLLSALFLNEPADELLSAFGSDLVPDGWEECRAWLAGAKAECTFEAAVEDVHVDFARLFANASEVPVHPYESVYVSPHGLLMQDPRDEVVAAYLASSFAADPTPHLPEDHIGFELAYLSELASEGRDGEMAAFLADHVLRWVDSLCDDVASRADTAFYRCLARQCRSFVHEEAGRLGVAGMK